MKKVLAELHQLINSLEDHGLTAEASSLQEVFVRVAQKADPNDLSEKVTDLLGKYSAPELIAALAEQMDSKDTKTMSFAFGEEPAGYGNEPKDFIVENYVEQAKGLELYDPSILHNMNLRLQFNGHTALTKKEFLAKVNSSDTNSSDTNVSEFAFGDKPDEFTESERQLGTEKNPLYKGVEGPNRMWKGHPISEMSRWNLPRQDEPAPYQQTAPVVSRESVISSYVLTAFNDKYGPNGRNAYTNLSDELNTLKYDPLSKEDFDNLVRKGLIPKKDGSYKQLQGQIVAPPLTPEIREQMKKDWDEMTERHKKMAYGSPAHQSAR